MTQAVWDATYKPLAYTGVSLLVCEYTEDGNIDVYGGRWCRRRATWGVAYPHITTAFRNAGHYLYLCDEHHACAHLIEDDYNK